MQHIMTITLAASTCFFAVLSAIYWWKSSQVTPLTMNMYDSAASPTDVPGLFLGAHQVSIDSMRAAANESARLNKWAAVWTGVSALFSAVTTVSGTIFLPF